MGEYRIVLVTGKILRNLYFSETDINNMESVIHNGGTITLTQKSGNVTINAKHIVTINEVNRKGIIKWLSI